MQFVAIFFSAFGISDTSDDIPDEILFIRPDPSDFQSIPLKLLNALFAMFSNAFGALLNNAFIPFTIPVMTLLPSPIQFTAPITEIIVSTIFGNSAIKLGIFSTIPLSSFIIMLAPHIKSFGTFSLIMSATFFMIVGRYAIKSGSDLIIPSTIL